VRGLRAALEQSTAMRIAVSPLVGGEALKGPTVPMMQSAGLPLTPLGVAQYYDGLIDALVIDKQDHEYKVDLEEAGLRVLVTDAIMEGFEGRLRLAAEVLDFRTALAGRSRDAPALFVAFLSLAFGIAALAFALTPDGRTLVPQDCRVFRSSDLPRPDCVPPFIHPTLSMLPEGAGGGAVILAGGILPLIGLLICTTHILRRGLGGRWLYLMGASSIGILILGALTFSGRGLVLFLPVSAALLLATYLLDDGNRAA
jgi:hypothetical protein